VEANDAAPSNDRLWAELRLPVSKRRDLSRALARGEQLVYFVQAVEGGPIKIGVARDPLTRLADLQVGSPYKLRLYGLRRGGVAEERRLHKRFRADRLQGEWFKASGELAELAGATPPEDAEFQTVAEAGAYADGLEIGRIEITELQEYVDERLDELREALEPFLTLLGLGDTQVRADRDEYFARYVNMVDARQAEGRRKILAEQTPIDDYLRSQGSSDPYVEMVKLWDRRR
jgi:Meiotically up-regulated gene 113